MSEERRQFARRMSDRFTNQPPEHFPLDQPFRVVDEEPAQRDMRDVLRTETMTLGEAKSLYEPAQSLDETRKKAAAQFGTFEWDGKPVPDADPWKHRSEGMKCKSCMWFVPKVPTHKLHPLMESQPVDLGRCRRHAPTMGGYPAVMVNDWCGDHRLDENKL